MCLRACRGWGAGLPAFVGSLVHAIGHLTLSCCSRPEGQLVKGLEKEAL